MLRRRTRGGPEHLRVLITQVWMHTRGGTESATRDLALQLQARGHFPTVYTPLIGTTGLELRAMGVPVIDDLAALAVTPDVIHGQHCIPTIEAIVRFPRVPVINVCHAWIFGIEAPLVMPQVCYHVGVDEACVERILHTEGVDPDNVKTVLNGVVLSRIPERASPLPAQPRSAAVVGKACKLAPLLHEVCAARGIDLTVIQDEPNPETRLVHFDLMFGSARSALEAICAGCAVVVCDERGVAGMVTRENVTALRLKNFGLQSLTQKASAAVIAGEIARYNAADAAAVTAMVRSGSNLDRFLDRYLKYYHRAIRRLKDKPVSEEEYAIALSRFLRTVMPRGVNPAVSMEQIGKDAISRLLELSAQNAGLAHLLAEAGRLRSGLPSS